MLHRRHVYIVNMYVLIAVVRVPLCLSFLACTLTLGSLPILGAVPRLNTAKSEILNLIPKPETLTLNSNP